MILEMAESHNLGRLGPKHMNGTLSFLVVPTFIDMVIFGQVNMERTRSRSSQKARARRQSLRACARKTRRWKLGEAKYDRLVSGDSCTRQITLLSRKHADVTQLTTSRNALWVFNDTSS